jgi:4-aminobutyrate aminotransferase-like enzyme
VLAAFAVVAMVRTKECLIFADREGKGPMVGAASQQVVEIMKQNGLAVLPASESGASANEAAFQAGRHSIIPTCRAKARPRWRYMHVMSS